MKKTIIISTALGLILAAFAASSVAAYRSFDDPADGRTAVMTLPAKTPAVPAQDEESPEAETEAVEPVSMATINVMDCSITVDGETALFNTALSSEDDGSLAFAGAETVKGHQVSISGTTSASLYEVEFPLERGVYHIDGYVVTVE